jgi:hypothetical protein
MGKYARQHTTSVNHRDPAIAARPVVSQRWCDIFFPLFQNASTIQVFAVFVSFVPEAREGATF